MKRIIAILICVMMAISALALVPSAESVWENIPLDASNVTYAAPSGGEIQKNITIEVGAPLNVSILPDQDDAYCEVTFTGTAFRLYMLCNVQDNGASAFNVSQEQF